MNTTPPDETTPSPTAFDDSGDLAAFVDRAWDAHAQHPREVATALSRRAAGFGADEASAAALRLAEHVWLAHLDDAGGLAAFLRDLPAGVSGAEQTAPLVRRAHWVLSMLGGPTAAAPVDDRLRWGGLQNLWSVWVARGRIADARAMLERERPRAMAHPDPSARRVLAATCNNLAVELRLGARGDDARDALMMALARASRELWAIAGTWLQTERAEYQLARCHAIVGDGTGALEHARACLEIIEAHAQDPAADAFERFFAHEALWWSCQALRDTAGMSAQREQMAQWLARIDDAGSRAWAAEGLAAADAQAT